MNINAIIYWNEHIIVIIVLIYNLNIIKKSF